MLLGEELRDEPISMPRGDWRRDHPPNGDALGACAVDALTDLIRGVRFSGAAFLMRRYTAAWQCAYPSHSDAPALPPGSHRVVLYHLITEGECHARLDDQSTPPLRLTSGDVLVVAGGQRHHVGTLVDEAPIAGRGHRTGVNSGYLAVDKDMSGPLLELLPPMFRVHLDGASAAWAEASMRLGVAEVRRERLGCHALLTSLSETVFADAVRRHGVGAPESQLGWLAGLRDPMVGRAVTLLQEHPADAWSVERLARRVGASRSVLAQRFVDLVGKSPMRYLMQWRLHLAAQQLRTSNRALGEIASEIGYASEAAFNRAFKRHLGVPPAAWRKQVRETLGPPSSPTGIA
jgi:AraC-like DNA-binding protein